MSQSSQILDVESDPAFSRLMRSFERPIRFLEHRWAARATICNMCWNEVPTFAGGRWSRRRRIPTLEGIAGRMTQAAKILIKMSEYRVKS